MFSLSKVLSSSLQHLKNYSGKYLQEIGGELERAGSKMTQDMAYKQVLSRHKRQTIINYISPKIGNSYVCSNASLIGEVHIGDYNTINFGTVMRAEQSAIRVGNYSFIGNSCDFTTYYSLPVGVPASINIGNNVIIEPNCSIASCIIDDNVYIGARSVIAAGAKIEKGAIIAPNSYVPHGRLIKSGQLWAGSPIKMVRELSEEEIKSNIVNSFDRWNSSVDKMPVLSDKGEVVELSEEEENKNITLKEKVNEYVSENYFKWRTKYYH